MSLLSSAYIGIYVGPMVTSSVFYKTCAMFYEVIKPGHAGKRLVSCYDWVLRADFGRGFTPVSLASAESVIG